MIWCIPFEQGRVVTMVIGHDLLAMTQPGFIQAFTRSVEWAATNDVKPEQTPRFDRGRETRRPRREQMTGVLTVGRAN